MLSIYYVVLLGLASAFCIMPVDIGILPRCCSCTELLDAFGLLACGPICGISQDTSMVFFFFFLFICFILLRFLGG